MYFKKLNDFDQCAFVQPQGLKNGTSHNANLFQASMSSDISIAIIGGGVVGCAVASELSTRTGDIFLFEKNPGITRGENQSSRNSGVVHSGIYYDRETRPLKAALCVEGNRLLYEFSRRHRVPALETGKLIVATTDEEDQVLDLYLNRARKNDVPGVEKIPGKAVRDMEPNVKARSALRVPSAGIVDPASLVYRLHALAHAAGVHFIVETAVTGLKGSSEFTELTFQYRNGLTDSIKAKVVINAAGADADRIALFLNPNTPYTLDPVRGDSYKFYSTRRPDLELKGRNIYPTPTVVVTPHGTHFTVGIHLTPTFEDLSYPSRPGKTVTVGPKLVAVKDRNAWMDDHPTPPGIFAESLKAFFPGIKKEDLIWHQAGLQGRLKDHPDFVIEQDPQYLLCINLLGIDSPGLTASLAIARRVAKMVDNLGIL